MAVTKHGQRKALVINWDLTKIQGLNASVALPEAGVNTEVVSTLNTGTARLLFPAAHTGSETVTVGGSLAGIDPGYAVAVITVGAAGATVDVGDGTITVAGVEKAIDIRWDKGGQLHGADVVLSVDGDEQSVVRNSGAGTVVVPWGTHGHVAGTVKASHQGSESATLPVT